MPRLTLTALVGNLALPCKVGILHPFSTQTKGVFNFQFTWCSTSKFSRAIRSKPSWSSDPAVRTGSTRSMLGSTAPAPATAYLNGHRAAASFRNSGINIQFSQIVNFEHGENGARCIFFQEALAEPRR